MAGAVLYLGQAGPRRHGPPRAWHELPLPACRHCGGKLVWAEAGQVPGARRCSGCGRRYCINCTPAPGGRTDVWLEEVGG